MTYARRIGIASLLALGVVGAAHAQGPWVLTRKAATFQRSDIIWVDPAQKAVTEKEGCLRAVMGWVEYDFQVPATGWYEFCANTEAGWTQALRVDGEDLYYGAFREEEVKPLGFKLQNLWLEGGRP